jgi:polyhydroxyalkanoate synthase
MEDACKKVPRAQQMDYDRKGPSPLPVHLGLAMGQYLLLQESGSVSDADLAAMLAGIKKYQNHPYRRHDNDLECLWHKGEVKIFCCPAENAAASVILIPSLINKSYILDLLPEISFARYLSQSGVDVYLLDWGAPMHDQCLGNPEDLLNERLVPAIRFISELAFNDTGQKPHALGYCMGGTFLGAAAHELSDALKSIIFLATPWDFCAGDPELADNVKAGRLSALQIMDKKGFLPRQWVQSVFAAVNANKAIDKFARFANLDDDTAQARLFVAVEDWLNDGVDLPYDLAKCCIIDWYQDNLPQQGRWKINGRTVDLSDIDLPALIIASEKDRLVPKESSLAMADMLRRPHIIKPDLGHIGMITSHKAEQHAWRQISNWLLQT